MDSPRICTWQGAEWPAGMDWSRFQCAILESAPSTKLVNHPNASVTPEAYDAGLAFGPEVELRWRKRRNGKFHITLIEDKPGAHWPEGAETAPLMRAEAAERMPQRVILWGEPVAGALRPEWYEPRIPNTITAYPRELENHRVAVELLHYWLEVDARIPFEDPEKSQVLLTRCSRLTAAIREER